MNLSFLFFIDPRQPESPRLIDSPRRPLSVGGAALHGLAATINLPGEEALGVAWGIFMTMSFNCVRKECTKSASASPGAELMEFSKILRPFASLESKTRGIVSIQAATFKVVMVLRGRGTTDNEFVDREIQLSTRRTELSQSVPSRFTWRN